MSNQAVQDMIYQIIFVLTAIKVKIRDTLMFMEEWTSIVYLQQLLVDAQS